MADHLYTLDPDGEGAKQNGYKPEGAVCLVLATAYPEVSTIPVYRYYSNQSGNHFYTIHQREGDALRHKGFYAENNGEPVWHVFSHQCCGTIPFFRWHFPVTGDYVYTTHLSGELGPTTGYINQGLLGYVFPLDTPPVGARKLLYRWYKGG